VVPVCLATVLMRAGAGEHAGDLARGLALSTAGFVTVCVAAFGGGWWLGSLLGDGVPADAVAIVTGLAGYFVGLVFLARPQIDLLRAALSRAPAPSGGPGPAGTPAPAVAPVSAYTGGRA
jgi:hypothetical protein